MSKGVAQETPTETKSDAPQTANWWAEQFGDVFPVSRAWTSTQSGTAGTRDLDMTDSGTVDTSGTQGSAVGFGGKTAVFTPTPDSSLRSVLREDVRPTPRIVPVRGNLESVKSLMKGGRNHNDLEVKKTSHRFVRNI